ncbi:PIR protein [Plasmodium brasilianum]|uniref:PIR protein n=2 Tax=Plasmodium (Plasmodium) TaxID=418103 RepID=A0A1D3TDJ9_PLAMA|nr:PIR protein [Plasmodium malariae]KAI4836002.1 PIR protein [Plasmodium brasilianum]SCP02972.1 PIR protein [Plasmodium malariae]
MASGDPAENENSVTLFLKYKKEFEDVILDIYNRMRGVQGENPGRKCALIEQNKPNFATPCQEVGRYLIEIKENYKSDSFKRCKYLNYRINSDDNYNNSSWFQGYRDFSSKTGNICTDEIKIIHQDVLNKLKQLYSYYDNFSTFNGKDNDSDGNICESVRECYNFYNNNYKECQQNSNDPFCEELINFKNAYDDKMNKFTPCEGLPKILPQIEQTSTQILPPTEDVDYVFVPILTTSIFTPLKSWIYYRLRKKKIIELNKFQEALSESLQNLHVVVNRNCEVSSHNITYQPQGDT